ncbi:ABC-2 type transport system ATP-binding protein [Desulfotomaculum arcticum]|uniref:ABC-2 type transport system ATP-binding protein n=1 Tax=Desulfotruncus arcticus DSM 17038 TaxID=1121424 RepID=A0A1I2NBX9_9FIRM|nr:ABC transporter ATP-binding protein [Desulfotruncus arcticus]SFF98871.1 ABC-2 type transport system ATP-binding protein [Desulfotomaculum arcticum] [Desulfotruncus arcticus DSM 17038]
MELAIETINLTKIYGNKIGCTDVCLRVPRGQIFGFLGPNGAGKSTLVKMLVGLLYPTSGQARLLGYPLNNIEIKGKIGFLPENFRYHDWLTLRELLEFHSKLYKLSSSKRSKQINAVIDTVGLTGKEHQKIRTFSKGMQQRAGLACALLSDPELIFLDEPTSALDPLGRMEVRRILLQLKDTGTTVFLNSHLLSEVEMVCDTVAFIKGGRILRQDSLEQLQSGEIAVELMLSGINDIVKLALSNIALSLTIDGDIVTAFVNNEDDIPRLAEAVIKSGAHLYEMTRKRSSLEETFIELTGGVDH